MEKRNVVLFDNDGTIMDTFDAIYKSLDYATQKVLDKKFPKDYLLSRVGQPLIDQMDLFTDDPGLQQEIMRVYKENNEDGLNQKMNPFPGISELFDALKAEGCLIGVVTSKREDLAKDGLSYFGLLDMFDCFVGPELSSKHKPEPEPLFVAAKLLNVSIDQCVYVGDSPYDIQAALAANIPALAVDWGKFFSRETLRKENPNCIVSTPEELLEVIRNAAY